MNLKQPFYNVPASSFLSTGYSDHGIDFSQILDEIKSSEQLRGELFEKLREKNSQIEVDVNFDELIETASKAANLIHENEKLTIRVQALEEILYAVLQKEDEAFMSPSFPQDFEYFGGSVKQSDEKVRGIVQNAAAIELMEGEFHYITEGNTAVIRLHDGDKIITVVAQDFFEATEGVEIPFSFT